MSFNIPFVAIVLAVIQLMSLLHNFHNRVCLGFALFSKRLVIVKTKIAECDFTTTNANQQQRTPMNVNERQSMPTNANGHQ